jgi:hypothetical protein
MKNAPGDSDSIIWHAQEPIREKFEVIRKMWIESPMTPTPHIIQKQKRKSVSLTPFRQVYSGQWRASRGYQKRDTTHVRSRSKPRGSRYIHIHMYVTNSSLAPGVFYTRFYNHAHRLRLEKPLYIELSRSPASGSRWRFHFWNRRTAVSEVKWPLRNRLGIETVTIL